MDGNNVGQKTKKKPLPGLIAIVLVSIYLVIHFPEWASTLITFLKPHIQSIIVDLLSSLGCL